MTRGDQTAPLTPRSMSKRGRGPRQKTIAAHTPKLWLPLLVQRFTLPDPATLLQAYVYTLQRRSRTPQDLHAHCPKNLMPRCIPAV